MNNFEGKPYFRELSRYDWKKIEREHEWNCDFKTAIVSLVESPTFEVGKKWYFTLENYLLTDDRLHETSYCSICVLNASLILDSFSGPVFGHVIEIGLQLCSIGPEYTYYWMLINGGDKLKCIKNAQKAIWLYYYRFNYFKFRSDYFFPGTIEINPKRSIEFDKAKIKSESESESEYRSTINLFKIQKIINGWGETSVLETDERSIAEMLDMIASSTDDLSNFYFPEKIMKIVNAHPQFIEFCQKIVPSLYAALCIDDLSLTKISMVIDILYKIAKKFEARMYDLLGEMECGLWLLYKIYYYNRLPQLHDLILLIDDDKSRISLIF